MHDPLAPLLHDGVIDEVLARLKSGKEADLWLVRHGEEVIAAKVYKARETRSFKNNSAYKEGRTVRNSRTQRAMNRGSRFGQAAAEEAWKVKEADALHALHAAGVRVPRPVMFYEGVMLMEVVVDAAGQPAPRLIDALVPPEQAAALYAGLREQVVRMLCADLIHGDLSPYNVLMAWDGPIIIDFPQVVGAAHNSQAQRFFTRDLENLRRFFAALDPALSAAAGDEREIWRAYERRELTPDFVPSGKPPPPERAPRAHGGSHGEAAHGAGQGRPLGAAHPGGHGQGRGQGRGEGRGEPGGRAHGDAGRAPEHRGDSRSEQRGGQRPERPSPGQRPAQEARAPQGQRPGQRGRRDARSGSRPEVIRVARPSLGQPAPASPPAHQRPGAGAASHRPASGGTGGAGAPAGHAGHASHAATAATAGAPPRPPAQGPRQPAGPAAARTPGEPRPPGTGRRRRRRRGGPPSQG